MKYILDGKTPVLEPDLIKWARWMQTAERHVAQTLVGEIRISTIFLGLDHHFGDGDSILFETRVFGGQLDQECERYETYEQAEQGHVAMAARVKATFQ